MSIVLIFGSGASYGSEFDSAFQTPLGIGEKGLFNRLCAQYPYGVASDIKNTNLILADEFVRDFESAFSRYANQDFGGKKLLNLSMELSHEVAKYFLSVQSSSDNLYLKIMKKISSRKLARKIVVVTTNYDLFLENAIEKTGLKVNYILDAVNMTSTFNHIDLYKIHGSPNFFPDFGSGSSNMFNNRISVRGSNITEGNVQLIGASSLKAVTSAEAIKLLSDGNQANIPVIAMYTQGKHALSCNEQLKRIKESFAIRLESATKIIIVGLRILKDDGHIWDAIANAQADTFYIAPNEQKSFTHWKENCIRTNIYYRDYTFKQALSQILKLI